MKKTILRSLLTGSFSFLIVLLTAQMSRVAEMNFSGTHRSNYPVVVTHQNGPLPQGWVYSFCTLTPYVATADPDTANQALWIFDDSLRPIFTMNVGPYNMTAQGYAVYYQGSMMGYNKDEYYYHYVGNQQVLPQAHGLFPRFDFDYQKRGFVAKDTLTGCGTAQHIPPTLDEHGIYLSDSFYVAMQNYNGWVDTGSGLALIKYDGSVIAQWSAKDPVHGLPQSQSFYSSCPGYYQFLPAGDVDHPNSVVSVGDSLFLISNRHRNEIVCLKFHWQTKTFTREWNLRHDLYSSFTWPDDSVGFAGQHALSILSASPQEIVLGLFDNGNCLTNESKYLEYVLDLEHMTVRTLTSVALGYQSVAMGAAYRIASTDLVVNSPGIFTPHPQGGMQAVSIMNTSGDDIAGIRFQADTVHLYTEANWPVYQARADSILFINTIRPTISTDCSGDSMMQLTLDQPYDNVLWELIGQTSPSIWLPKTKVRTMVTVYNNGTEGEWHAYSEGCAQDTATGIGTLPVSNFGVYPNPAHNFINIVGDMHQNESYTISDVRGSVVQSGELQSGGSNNVRFNLTVGVYVIRFSDQGQMVAKKIIVY